LLINLAQEGYTRYRYVSHVIGGNMRNRRLTELLTRSYATWQAPGSRAIRLSSLVMDGIYTEVMKDFDAVAGPGAEAGGILLGRRTENEIVVDEYEPALCEYRFGPSFRLSDSDRIGLREKLERLRKHEALSIVGWYRSDTRQEFALDEEDRELLNNELQPESDVTLLIKPGRSQPYEVKLFLREEGRLLQALQTTRFPFDRPAPSLRDLFPAEPVKGKLTSRTQATLSWVEQRLSNPTIDGLESFDPGNGNTADEVHQAASPEPQEPKYPDAASANAREIEDAAPTLSVEPEPKLPFIQPTAEQEEPAASDMRDVAEPPEPRAEFGPIESFDREGLLAEQPPQERRPRKWTFVIGTLVFTAICGTIGYYSVTSRPTAPASTWLGKQDPTPVAAIPTVPAPRPVSASPTQTASPDSAVLAPSPKENTLAGRNTDWQVRTFLRKWVDAEKSTNIGDLTALYAPQLSRYFTKEGVTRADVRAARELDIAKYGKLIVCDIKDITVKVLDSGHVAATFRKRWQTAGPSVLMGEGQDELTLVLDQGKWQIEAEKRIMLYRERKEYYAPGSQRTAEPPK
jgi:hypothetical protein